MTLYYWVKIMDTKLNLLKDEKITRIINVILSKYNKEYHEDLKQELFLKLLEILNKSQNIKSLYSYILLLFQIYL